MIWGTICYSPPFFPCCHPPYVSYEEKIFHLFVKVACSLYIFVCHHFFDVVISLSDHKWVFPNYLYETSKRSPLLH